jgi:hypothetical protein
MRKISTLMKPYRHGATSISEAWRRVKGPVYAIAFGIGLAIWFLLLRNTVSPPPAPPVHAFENATHRSADATRRTAGAPKLTMTVSGPQDLRPMETPRGETNDSVRPLPDNTFENVLALVVRAPQRPMETPRGETYGSVRPAPDNTFENVLALVVRKPQRPMDTPRGEIIGRFCPMPDNTVEKTVALFVGLPQVDAGSAHSSKTRAQKIPARTTPSLRPASQRVQARPNETTSTRARRSTPTSIRTPPTLADQKRLFQRVSARFPSEAHSREPR